jgi:hypothetical protein
VTSALSTFSRETRLQGFRCRKRSLRLPLAAATRIICFGWQTVPLGTCHYHQFSALFLLHNTCFLLKRAPGWLGWMTSRRTSGTLVQMGCWLETRTVGTSEALRPPWTSCWLLKAISGKKLGLRLAALHCERRTKGGSENFPRSWPSAFRRHWNFRTTGHG